MEPNAADSLNEEIKVIWNKFLSKDKTELHPVYFKPISETQITFVGMNPSFNKKGITKTIKNGIYSNLDIEQYFKLSNHEFDIEVSNDIDRLSQEKYPFFKQHKALADHLKLSTWNHLDLFQYRQTSQKQFMKMILNRDDSLNEFGKAQFNLFMKALELSSPKMILLANAKASKIFQKNTQTSFCEKKETYVLHLNAKKTPIFLSGMLTGGRALDIFSRERLFWHMEQVYLKL